MCYVRAMDVASRELRNNTRAVLQLVESGEAVTITVDGRPIAVLEPLSRRRRWMSREEFIRHVARRQADPALRSELRTLAPDTTDELAR
jgi:prevent-host-death family protein